MDGPLFLPHYSLPLELKSSLGERSHSLDGDEDNDFEMIEYAGKGIAMHNAIPELKSLTARSIIA